MPGYILSFDQGTTSTRAVLLNQEGRPVASARRSHTQIYERPGWVAHNPREIIKNVIETGEKALQDANINAADLAAIAITNQRETTVAWNGETGEPACDAIVWQCRRTAELCAKITADSMEEVIRGKTGLLPDPYFSATKIKWILENVPKAQEWLAEGKLLVGTVDSWLIWHLAKGLHVTDYTNASRTMLLNIHTLQWDQDLLDYFGIPESILPKLVPNSGVIGVTDPSLFGVEIPIAGVAGDQHAALFGQCCFAQGDVKNTYGTGCFILKNTGDKPVMSEHKLLTTIAWRLGGKTAYALEGSVFNAGSAIEWLIREMGLVADVRELNDICNATPDTGGVYLVPAFTGLGAPHWDMYARGAVCGMSLSTNKNHVVRAAVESIAYQSRDVIETMNREAGIEMDRLRVDGGVTNSAFAMQFQADLLQIPVERPKVTETTVLGASYLAGLGVGFWRDLDEIRTLRKMETVYRPQKPAGEMEELYRNWLKAVEKAKGWALEARN